MSYLTGVTLSGARPGGRLKGYSILPLNQGKLDNFKIMSILSRLGYSGRVGFQGYDVCGDVYANLKIARDTFNDITRRIEAHPK